MLSKLTTVSSMLFHSEGPPTKSAYDVVDQMELASGGSIEKTTSPMTGLVSFISTRSGFEIPLVALKMAESGEYEDAILVAQRARELAIELGDESLADEIQKRIGYYEQGKPYRAKATKAILR